MSVEGWRRPGLIFLSGPRKLHTLLLKFLQSWRLPVSKLFINKQCTQNSFKVVCFYFMCVRVCLRVCMCITHVLGPHVSQKRVLDPMELESWMVVSRQAMLGIRTSGPLPEQQVL